MPKPSARYAAFESALAWFRERVPLTQRQAEALENRADRRAFKVAGLAELRVVNAVFKAVDRAVRDGTTLDDFKKEIGASLEASWQGTVKNPSARMETIFRTNLQSAYSAGRVRELRSADTMAVRPFWLFSALMDLRTTDICKTCNGTVTQADSGWFKNHTPPLHYNCRSTIISLTAERAAVLGGPTRHPPADHPPDGFGDIEDRDPTPDLSDVDSELAGIYRAKVLAHEKGKRK